MNATTPYGFFPSHNRIDKPLEEQISQWLVYEARLQPYLDKRHPIPVVAWQPELENVIGQSKTVAAYIGPSGNGPWHHEEMQLALMRAVREKSRIPRHPRAVARRRLQNSLKLKDARRMLAPPHRSRNNSRVWQ